jgi:hypothetical protein
MVVKAVHPALSSRMSVAVGGVVGHLDLATSTLIHVLRVHHAEVVGIVGLRGSGDAIRIVASATLGPRGADDDAHGYSRNPFFNQNTSTTITERLPVPIRRGLPRSAIKRL